jgi:hypothetical protein
VKCFVKIFPVGEIPVTYHLPFNLDASVTSLKGKLG